MQSKTYLKHLLRRAIISHIIVLGVYLLAALSLDQVARADDYSSDIEGALETLLLGIYSLPPNLLLLYPAITAISAAFALFSLAQRREFMALQAAGMPPVALALQLGTFAILFHGAIILGTSHLVETWETASENLKERKQETPATRDVDLWAISESLSEISIINAESLSEIRRELFDVAIVTTDNNFADATIKHAQILKNEANSWTAIGHDFPKTGELINFTGSFQHVISGWGKATRISFFNLRQVIENLEKAGLTTRKYRLEFYKIIGLVIYPPLIYLWVQALAIFITRSRTPSQILSWSFKALVITLMLYVIYRPLTAYATSGAISIEYVAYIPHIIVAISGIITFKRSYST